MLSSFLLFLDVYGHNPKKKQPTFLIVPPPPLRPTSLQKIGIFSSHSFSKFYLIANHPPFPSPAQPPMLKEGERGEACKVCTMKSIHCVKSGQIRSFFWSIFFLYSVRIRENTDQKKLRTWTLFTQ